MSTIKKQKGSDYSKILIWSSAAVVMVRYTAAFIASDIGKITGWMSELITMLMGVSGLGMGLLTVLGQTYTFDGWRRSIPRAGQKWAARYIILTVFVFALIATDVAILIPFTVSRVEQVSMAEVLSRGELYWWSGLVNVAPALLIAGVALGNQVVNVTQSESTQTYRKVSDNLPERNKLDWRKVRKDMNPEDVTWLRTARTEEICFRFGIDDRTARNWRKNAQKES